MPGQQDDGQRVQHLLLPELPDGFFAAFALKPAVPAVVVVAAVRVVFAVFEVLLVLVGHQVAQRKAVVIADVVDGVGTLVEKDKIYYAE